MKSLTANLTGEDGIKYMFKTEVHSKKVLVFRDGIEFDIMNLAGPILKSSDVLNRARDYMKILKVKGGSLV